MVGLGVHIGWTKHVSAQAVVAQQAQAAASAVAAKKLAIFKSQTAALQAANPLIDVSIAVSSQSFGLQRFGDTGSYSAASIGKLITAAAYLHLVDERKVSLEQSINGKTARYWINVMLVNSDDEAWQLLNAQVTHQALSAYGVSIGLTHYDVSTDSFPAADAAILLQKLQNGSLLSIVNQKLMLNWLARANYRAYLVPAVPSGSQVFHKAGFDGDNLHDAAIIKKGDNSFVLVIFTNGHGNYDWDGRARLIQEITRDAEAAYL
ncbi:MAG: serine hydrolase [Candidatus Saccharibacteria bacterium]